jgi:hypothetical protein
MSPIDSLRAAAEVAHVVSRSLDIAETLSRGNVSSCAIRPSRITNVKSLVTHAGPRLLLNPRQEAFREPRPTTGIGLLR